MKSKYDNMNIVDIYRVTIGDVVEIIRTNNVERMQAIFRSTNKLEHANILCKWIFDISEWEGKPLSSSDEMKAIAMRKLNEISKSNDKEDIAL